MNLYLFVLRKPAARWSYFVAFIARLPVAMTPLGLLILVEEASGSYAEGGLVAGAFALGHAVSAPLWGRALDTGSHGRVVAATAMASSAFLAMSWLATEFQSGPLAAAGMALCVGLFFPPVTPAMRVAWRRLVPASVDALAAAYALIAAGATRGEKAAARAGRRGQAGVMRQGVFLVGLVAVAMALGFGQMDVALTSTARATSGAGMVLWLMFAAVGVGSIAGGLLFGARQWNWPPHRLLTASLAGFGLGLASTGLGLWLIVSPLLLLSILLVAGLFISPSLLLLLQLVDRALPSGRTAEGQAWLGAVMTVGSAIGMALGGVWADTGQLTAAFLAAAVPLAVGSITATVARDRLGRSYRARERGCNLRLVKS